jgi:hypothetical protein
MRRRHQQSGAGQQKQEHGAHGHSDMGGREFGNVIEPMQAQMASGNEGLTGDAEKKPAEKHEPRKRGKKAA